MIVTPLVLVAALATDTLPDFHADLWWNSIPLTMEQVRGRTILVTVFRTEEEDCTSQIPHLNRLAADYKKKGLIVVGVTVEDKKLLNKYVNEHGVEFRIAHLVSSELEDAIGAEEYPFSVILDPEGELVWKGHPAEADDPVKTHTKGSKRTALLPEPLSRAEEYMDKHQYGPAYREIRRVQSGRGLEDQEQETAEQVAAHIQRMADRLMSASRDALGDRDWYTASLKLQVLVDQYDGVGPDRDARLKLDGWRNDKSVQTEIAAGEKMAEARELEEQRLYDKAWSKYKSIAKKYKDTKTGAKAATRVTELQESGFLGMNAKCPDCQEAGKACERHGR